MLSDRQTAATARHSNDNTEILCDFCSMFCPNFIRCFSKYPDSGRFSIKSKNQYNFHVKGCWLVTNYWHPEDFKTRGPSDSVCSGMKDSHETKV